MVQIILRWLVFLRPALVRMNTGRGFRVPCGWIQCRKANSSRPWRLWFPLAPARTMGAIRTPIRFSAYRQTRQRQRTHPRICLCRILRNETQALYQCHAPEPGAAPTTVKRKNFRCSQRRGLLAHGAIRRRLPKIIQRKPVANRESAMRSEETE
jgi:hypothetical protein